MTPLSFLEKQVAGFVEELAKETDVVRRSEMFKAYLDAVSKFWHYSFHNQVLIYLQKKDASRVAGFVAWNKLGRSVLKGSEAIKILAPFTKKVLQKDENGEEKERSFTYFVPVNVFDVSQTKGKELPKLDIEVKGDNQKELLEKLLEFCKQKNIEVEFRQLGVNGLYGYSKGGKISIDCNQSVNTQANTLIHEIAHELLHYSLEGKQFSKQEKETQAEAITYVVTRHFGLENKSALYWAAYDSNYKNLSESLKQVSETTGKILNFLEQNQLLEEEASKEKKQLLVAMSRR